MTSYLVNFYKTLLSSDGHPYKCLQYEISIRDAPDPGQAIARAQREVERTSHASDWRHQADTMEIIEVVPDLLADPGSLRHAA